MTVLKNVSPDSFSVEEKAYLKTTDAHKRNFKMPFVTLFPPEKNFESSLTVFSTVVLAQNSYPNCRSLNTITTVLQKPSYAPICNSFRMW